MADLFDSIAVEKTADKKKESTIPIVDIKPDQKEKVDKYVKQKKTVQEEQIILNELENQIRGEGKELLINHIMKSNFTKSIILEGDDNRVRLTLADRFTVTGKEKELKEILGPKYALCFEKELTVQVKPEVLKDEKSRAKFLEKFSEEEVAQYFTSTNFIKTKKGFDETQYDLTQKERDKLRPLVTQAAPGITVL